MRTFKIPPIETEEEYDAALVRLAELMEGPESKAAEAEREALLEAIEEYEDNTFPLGGLPPRN
ncbi:MAG: hypothetical protein U0176_14560 [Bacteroidia bacterium]